MHDTGFAPCIEDEVLSLCCCKPKIRSSAKVGDYIVAFYGKSQPRKKFGHSLAYIAKITGKMDFRKYYELHKGRTDCIYKSCKGDGLEQIPNEFHDENHKKTDLGGGYCLVSDDFVFFGEKNMKMPEEYLGMIAGRGHNVTKNNQFKKTFPRYFENLSRGKLGQHIHLRRRKRKRSDIMD